MKEAQQHNKCKGYDTRETRMLEELQGSQGDWNRDRKGRQSRRYAIEEQKIRSCKNL